MCWIWLGVHSYQENLGAYLGYRYGVYTCYSGAIWGPSGIFGNYIWVISTFRAIGAIGGHQGYQWYSVGLSWLRGAIWGLSGLFGWYWSHFGAIVVMWGPSWVIQGLFQGLEGGYHTYSLGLTLACNYSVWTKPMLLLKCRIPDFLVRSPEFWLHYWTTALLV